MGPSATPSGDFAPLPPFRDGDEANYGGKRHFETWLGETFRFDQKDERCRKHDRAHAQGGAIREDGEKHHRQHDVGAHGGCFATADEKIERRSQQGCDGSPFLDWIIKRDGRK